MSKVDWRTLMRLGLVNLRLSPEIFWSLTPAELMLMAGLDREGASLSRGGFANLSAQFPDKI